MAGHAETIARRKCLYLGLCHPRSKLGPEGRVGQKSVRAGESWQDRGLGVGPLGKAAEDRTAVRPQLTTYLPSRPSEINFRLGEYKKRSRDYARLLR